MWISKEVSYDPPYSPVCTHVYVQQGGMHSDKRKYFIIRLDDISEDLYLEYQVRDQSQPAVSPGLQWKEEIKMSIWHF